MDKSIVHVFEKVDGKWESSSFDGSYFNKRSALKSLTIHYLKVDLAELKYFSDSVMEWSLHNKGVTVLFKEGS